MRHRHGYRKLSRTSSHRKALLKNLAIALITNGRIETTLPNRDNQYIRHNVLGEN